MKNVICGKDYRINWISKYFGVPVKELLKAVADGKLISTGGIGEFKFVTGESLLVYFEMRKEALNKTEVEPVIPQKFDFFENYKTNRRKVINNIVRRCERRG
ncbi:MAG: hypothetical protein A2499_03065 [Stygiobacter sp. RIFOXYC12_FULL_38_8]|nr:MAG: hypothetical protein A2279_09010 [Stygiobacter sp. RIFOXYA12_FULL_38_9]OGV06644.1 MAG: hypothetical protein A2299_01510 [Stygiobacter sp. RIFOXYB2_FULL_37_11]OGV11508.1 MAG: hypothetical protein A2237_05490 [Stygiobacter sp. RIFOXYA2_FULL_38_8]OGV15028.1 MAG: hypothetical protein A2440_06675 [Stygiobacter sp. RIFOXYC2_FULL_38_25]OGV22092.1 MAG: hypothetical protein A2499_03065 [Stygiobacter sp. RIFOXYC12_FULL_38_8]OGV79602.1 MAG: hypothetical protein A2X65_18755 [Stygiobacter sp. GWF2_